MEPSFYFVRDSTRFSELPRPPPNPPQYKLGVQKHARIQRGVTGGPDPLKNHKKIDFLEILENSQSYEVVRALRDKK